MTATSPPDDTFSQQQTGISNSQLQVWLGRKSGGAGVYVHPLSSFLDRVPPAPAHRAGGTDRRQVWRAETAPTPAGSQERRNLSGRVGHNLVNPKMSEEKQGNFLSLRVKKNAGNLQISFKYREHFSFELNNQE